MAGINLRAATSASFMGGSGVSAALPPSYAGSAAGATISARAYGVGSIGPGGGPRTPALGACIAAAAGTVVLLYLWYSLPH